ncbi:MAG: TonB-dependent receptor plug domain-containing protein [Prolixibacteraceae bacterium]
MKSTLLTTIKITLLIFVLSNQQAFSQNKTSITEEDLFEMSLEDLLNQSITTVSKSAEKIGDAPGIVSVLTKEDIAMFGGTTLSSVLERIPGLSLSSASFTDRSIVSSRGEQITSTSNHVLLLIDGRPIRETLEGGVSSEMYESFPVNVIERIEVIKGPGSVLYGSNAFSGVVNIITQQANKTGLSVSGLAGTSGTKGTSANLNVKAGDFEMLVAGNYLQKPVWETDFTYSPMQMEPNQAPTVPDTLLNPNPTGGPGGDLPQGAQQTTQSVSIPNEGASLFLKSSYKNLSFMSSYNQWETMTFETPGAARWKKSFSNLGYDLNFSDKWNSNINVSFTNSKFDTDSFPNIQRNSYEILTEWTHNVSLSDKSKLVFGGLYSYSKGEETNLSNESAGVEGHRYSVGAYAQADYQLLKSLKATAGLQINKIENIDPKFVPRAALVWNPTKHLNFKALYSEAFRAPSIIELSLDQPFRQGNSELQPETVGTIDLGANYRNDKFQIGLNYFHSKLNDIISLDHTFDIPTYQNLGEVIFNGGEMETKYYLTRELFFTGSALYQTNKNDNGVENLSPTANFSAKAGLNYSWDKGISLGVFNCYQGALDESYSSSINSSPIESFNKLSAHINFNINKLFLPQVKQEISMFIHADNLLNKEIWTFTKAGQQNSSFPFNQGRMVYAGLSFKLF